MVTPETILSLQNDVRYRVIDDEAIILKQSAGEILTVNRTGAAILDLLKDGESLPGLVRRLVTRFDVEVATAEADVTRFLAELNAANILTT